MNCNQARRIIHELLDGDLDDRTRLNDHLNDCPACRRYLRRCESIHAAVAESVRTDDAEQAAARATDGVIPALRARQGAPIANVGWPRIAAVAAGLALLFLGGIAAGHWLWPQYVTHTKTVKVPCLQTRYVHVPVVTERVVEKRVPVIKTRTIVKRIPIVKTRTFGKRVPVPDTPTPVQNMAAVAKPTAADVEPEAGTRIEGYGPALKDAADESRSPQVAQAITEPEPRNIVISLDADPDVPPPTIERNVRPARIAEGAHDQAVEEGTELDTSGAPRKTNLTRRTPDDNTDTSA